MFKIILNISAAYLALSTITTANATPLLFTVTGPDDFSFTIESPSSPSGQYTGSLGFPALYFEDIIVQGSAEDITFYGASSAGGFSVGSLPGDDQGTVLYDFIRGYGKQLYEGTIDAPVFAIGSYPLLGGYPSTLVISAPASVPETTTWAMMLAGMTAIGFATRRRAACVTYG